MAAPQLSSNSLLPSYATIYSSGIAFIHPLSYFPGTNPTSTDSNLNIVLSSIPPGLGTTSASNPVSSGVGSGFTSSSTSTTSSSPVGALPPSSVTPGAPIPTASTSDTATPILSTLSSTSPSTFTSSSKPTGQTNSGTPVPPHSNRLPNGTVAGIVIGVALGVALITFFATLLVLHRKGGLVLRRRGGSRGQSNRQRPDIGGGASGATRNQPLSSEPKQPFVTQTSSGSNSIDGFLPQSADDKTVQNEVKTVLDQIELHVENFYQNTPASGSRLADAELAMFDSPYLPTSLASLLQQTNNSIPIIKHALAQFVTACITTPSDPDWSLLPEDFVLLPNAVRKKGSTTSTKPGLTQSMSRWRALTAYLRPNALEDTDYIAERDRQINIIVQNFSIAFAPWQNPRYKDEERVHSLVAILKDAADKGIWLFSQPSEFQFQWRKLSPSRIAVAPALVKITDERGHILGEPQVMINMTATKL